MARRKQSFIENLIDVSSKLPWWLGVGLAMAAYFGLHSLSGSEGAAVVQPGVMGKFTSQSLLKSLVDDGQYVLPAVFLLVAAMSAYGRSMRNGLLERVTTSLTQGALNKMSWQQFETLVAEAFRRKGYSVTEKGGGLDGDIDLVLKKAGASFLVQFKQWRAIKVGVNTVRELHVVMANRGARGGFVLTSGVFTDEAQAFAKGKNIKLMDGKALRALLRGVTVPAKVFRDPLSILTRGAPFCPECQGRMKKRKASKGPHVGKAYWRCLRYPDCKGRRPA